jgi:uncharacterized Tic20 family protein
MSEKKSTVNWAMVCHLGGLATYIGIPLGNILVPLIIWLVRRNSDAAVNENGREAINFNISFTVYGIVAGLLCYVLVGFVLLPIVLITHIVLVVQAALKANKGESVQYPFTLHFIN